MESNYFMSDELISKLEEGLFIQELTEIIIHKAEHILSYSKMYSKMYSFGNVFSKQQYGHSGENWFIYSA